MIIVAKLNYDVVSIKWINHDRLATIETEREKVVEEYGVPFREKELENIDGIELVYDSYSSFILTEKND